MRIYSSNELPEPKTMYLATAEANNLAAVHASLEYYRAEMEGVCGGARPYEDPAVIESRHAELRAEAGRRFAARKKMGGAEFSRRYQQQLDSEIDTYYTECVRQNEQKNVFRTARTPGTLFLTIVLAYVLYCVLDLIGMRCVLFSSVLFFALITLSRRFRPEPSGVLLMDHHVCHVCGARLLGICALHWQLLGSWHFHRQPILCSSY